ncbi:uncharacterized protein LOC143075260 isoform X2 [Mytilus galloprovincialis]|uniref:uncharacterized protein LOC143075260 isoform X2 n=1 Tax=Mytilus galloprovincialis TaxID=29158 RepID=UPI003F7BA69F
MYHISTLTYLLQSVLYCLVSIVCSQSDELRVNVTVLNSTCTINGRNECRNKYLQICYKNKLCGRKMAVDCFVETFDHPERANLNALSGSNLKLVTLDKISSVTNIIVGITEEPKTNSFPLATTCENSRTLTTNGFIVKTSSADDLYQFTLSIDVVCKIDFCGIDCHSCDTTMLSTGKVTTLNISRSQTTYMITTLNTSRTTIKTLTTLSTLHTTSRSTTTVVDGRKTTGFKTNKASGVLTDILIPITTTEGYITYSYNGTTQTTNGTHTLADSNEHSQNITVIVVPVAVILGILVVVILIYVFYRKHNQRSRTSPAEDEKNRLVVNEDTEGDDRHSIESTDRSNGVQKNNVNLQIQPTLKEKDVVHAKTENVDETVSCRVYESETISTKHNDTTDTNSKEVNSELEDYEVSNTITENQKDTERSNIRMEPENSVHTDTDDKIRKRHKKKKKRKISDTEENMYSTSADLSKINIPANGSNDIHNGQNNGYVPDDEHSDAAKPYESDELSERKSDDIAMSSPVDNNMIEYQEIESKSKSNSQNENIKLNRSTENEELSDGGQNNKSTSNSEDVSGNNVPFSDSGVINHQAQSNGGFPQHVISRNDIENIAQAKVETIMHGKMIEMSREITEHTNNSINQVKEDVSVLQQTIQEKMLQNNNEIKEQINKNTEDIEKAKRKGEKKMQKLKDQIHECNERLRIFEARIKENMQNQKLLEEKVVASGGKQDDGSREIIETENEIQKLRDEMNRLSENLRQQISQQKGVISVPDTPLFTKTTHVSKGQPDSNDLLRSRTASDDALYRKHSDSIAATDQHSELEKKRKKKKRKRTPSIRFPGDGTVHIQHEDNTIDIEQIGPMEVQQTNRGIRLTGGNVEIDIKSPRKKTSSPQKDQTT